MADLEAGDEYDKLSELLKLTKENNKILRSMHRRMLWSQIFTFIYWLAILGVVGWSYYFIQPHLVQYLETYQNVINAFSSVDSGSNSSLPNFQGLLEKVR